MRVLYLAIAAILAYAPPEWSRYMTDDYLYCLVESSNDKGLDEGDFRSGLCSEALVGLARMVEVRVQDDAAIRKEAVDGRSRTEYEAETRFHTEVNMSLASTLSWYDRKSGSGSAIAYVDRNAALDFYRQKVRGMISEFGGICDAAAAAAASGRKTAARKMLEEAAGDMPELDGAFQMFGFFCRDSAEYGSCQARIISARRHLHDALSEYSDGPALYLSCGDRSFSNAVRGGVDGRCHFVNDEEIADFIVEIELSFEDASVADVAGSSVYTVRSEAFVSVVNAISGVESVNRKISAKGVNLSGFEKARRDSAEALAEKVRGTINDMIYEN